MPRDVGAAGVFLAIMVLRAFTVLLAVVNTAARSAAADWLSCRRACMLVSSQGAAAL